MFKLFDKFGAKKESSPEKEEKEISDIISIIDIGPKYLDRVTPENIREIISKGEGILKKRRAEARITAN